jgi:hypothetical protein
VQFSQEKSLQQKVTVLHGCLKDKPSA